MRHYPLLVNMQGARCLVVGAGEVGCRKLADLLTSAVADVLVLDTATPSARLRSLLQDTRVCFVSRAFIPGDVEGRTLVFAATADHAQNRAVRDECARHGVLCNCADAPENSGFIVPARICEGRITVTLSTQGGSPALAKRLRETLTPQVRRLVPLAEFLARVRPHVLELGLGTAKNTTLFRTLLDSGLEEMLASGNRSGCEALLRAQLPPRLHERITELLYGLV